MQKKAVFLDRDGVINQDVENYILRTEDVVLFDGVCEAIRYIKEIGFLVIVVSNQPAIARGLLTEENLKKINEFINWRIDKNVATKIDAFYFCPHHPDANLPKYKKECNCRKPSAGLLLKAARDFDVDLRTSFMVGDRVSDIVAGKSAGCKTILIQNKWSRSKIRGVEYDGNTESNFIASSLKDAVKFIE